VYKPVYTTEPYRNEIAKTAEKEKELLRLLQVKSEKVCNVFLINNQHTQLSYLPTEEQAGALALPKGLILDKLLRFLHSL